MLTKGAITGELPSEVKAPLEKETFIIYLEPSADSPFHRGLTQARELLGSHVGYDDSHLYPLHCSASSFFDVVTNSENGDETAEASDSTNEGVSRQCSSNEHDAGVKASSSSLSSSCCSSALSTKVPVAETLASNFSKFFNDLFRQEMSSLSTCSTICYSLASEWGPAESSFPSCCSTASNDSAEDSGQRLYSDSAESNHLRDAVPAPSGRTKRAPVEGLRVKEGDEDQREASGAAHIEKLDPEIADPTTMLTSLFFGEPEEDPDQENFPWPDFPTIRRSVASSSYGADSDDEDDSSSLNLTASLTQTKFQAFIGNNAIDSQYRPVFDVNRAPAHDPSSHPELEHVCVAPSGCIVFPIESALLKEEVGKLCDSLEASIYAAYPNAQIGLSRRPGITGIKSKPGTHVKLFQGASSGDHCVEVAAHLLDKTVKSQDAPLYWDIVLYKLSSWGELGPKDEASGRSFQVQPHDLIEIARVQNIGRTTQLTSAKSLSPVLKSVRDESARLTA